MPTSPAIRLVLARHELIALAAGHERAERDRYRRLAFGFLTYSPALSRLMAALGVECEQRLDRLYEASEPPFHTAADPLPPSARTGFILAPAQALDALHQTLADAAYSQRFYTHLRQASAVPALDGLLATLLRHKASELAVLQEQLAVHDPLASAEPGRCRVGVAAPRRSSQVC